VFHEREGPVDEPGRVGGNRVDGLAGVDAAMVLLDQSVAGGAQRAGGDHRQRIVARFPGQQVGQVARSLLGGEEGPFHQDRGLQDELAYLAGEWLAVQADREVAGPDHLQELPAYGVRRGLSGLPLAHGAGRLAEVLLHGPEDQVLLAYRGWSARTFTISGTVTTALAFVLLSTTAPDTSLRLIRAALLLVGAGFGQLIGQLILLVQNSAPRHQLGVATTSIRFFQTLGNALGTAVFGTVLARLYAADGPGGDISALARLTGAAHTDGVHAFVSAMDVVFWGAAGVMALGAVPAVRLPKSGHMKGGPMSESPWEEQPVTA